MLSETSTRANVDILDDLPNDLETAPASAKFLHMSEMTWHRHRQDERDPLPCYRLGCRWFASRREILAWVARRSNRDRACA
jgi:hypothetical protein